MRTPEQDSETSSTPIRTERRSDAPPSSPRSRAVLPCGTFASTTAIRLFGDFAIVHARTTYQNSDGSEGDGRYTDEAAAGAQ
jgi:hypothetical protein